MVDAPQNRIEEDIDEGRARINAEGSVVAIRPNTWQSVDLSAVLSGARRALEPAYLKRSDGQALLYPGAPHVFYGASETLKTWAAILAAKSYLDEGRHVLFIDFESNDISFVDRARKIGIKDGHIGRDFRYVRPEEPLYFTQRDGTMRPNEDAVFALIAIRENLDPALVIVDGVSEAYSLHGWSINAAEDAAKFQRVFGNWGEGVASIAIDHSGKDASLGVVGSQHKRSGLDGAQIEFTTVRREGIGGHSIAAMYVRKDRHGSIRAIAPTEYLGCIHVADEVWLQAPKPVDDPAVKEREAVLKQVTENPGESGRACADALGADRQRIGKVLNSLVVDGAVRSEPGPRRSKLWYVVPDTTDPHI